MTDIVKHGPRRIHAESRLRSIIFGSRGIASEVVSGKRAISKVQAKKLAHRFHVPAGLFV